MDKLSKFASSGANKAEQAQTREGQEIFKLFKKYTDKIIEE